MFIKLIIFNFSIILSFLLLLDLGSSGIKTLEASRKEAPAPFIGAGLQSESGKKALAELLTKRRDCDESDLIWQELEIKKPVTAYLKTGDDHFETWTADGIQEGIASWYGANFHDGPTASGETYDMYSLTAAHRHLPFDSVVRVTNLCNKRSVVVRINNRGPFTGDRRIIDLSKKAAQELGMKQQGLAEVRVEVLKAP